MSIRKSSIKSIFWIVLGLGLALVTACAPSQEVSGEETGIVYRSPT